VYVAVRKIDPEQNVASYLIKVLKKPNLWTSRTKTVFELRHFNDEASFNVLLNYLNDPDKLIRFNAARAILYRGGINPTINNFGVSHPLANKFLLESKEEINDARTKLLLLVSKGA
jgi:HEAT repeat protein